MNPASCFPMSNRRVGRWVGDHQTGTCKEGIYSALYCALPGFASPLSGSWMCAVGLIGGWLFFNVVNHEHRSHAFGTH
jgi:hypothetical protein